MLAIKLHMSQLVRL